VTRGRATRKGRLTGGPSLSGAAMRACERAAEADVRGARIGLKAGRKGWALLGCEMLGRASCWARGRELGRCAWCWAGQGGLGRAGHWAERERKKGKWAGWVWDFWAGFWFSSFLFSFLIQTLLQSNTI